MNYKDKTFEIEDNHIEFKNRIFVLLMIIFISTLSSLFLYKWDVIYTTGLIVGLLLVFFIIRFFFRMDLKNTIKLSDIEYVKVQIWDKSNDGNKKKLRNGREKYYFPTGLNKKKNSKVIFVHIKGRKTAVGFVPENMENVISVLKEKGIKITT